MSRRLCSFVSYLSCRLCHCLFFFFFNDTATTEIYTLSLHDALPIARSRQVGGEATCRSRWGSCRAGHVKPHRRGAMVASGTPRRHGRGRGSVEHRVARSSERSRASPGRFRLHPCLPHFLARRTSTVHGSAGRVASAKATAQAEKTEALSPDFTPVPTVMPSANNSNSTDRKSVV